MELANSFESLPRTFSPVFTKPSFQTFRLLMTGSILSARHRYVTDLIISSDSVGNGRPYRDYEWRCPPRFTGLSLAQPAPLGRGDAVSSLV